MIGKAINPLLLEGQVHGGGQGLGQALLESCAYDPSTGQLLSASRWITRCPERQCARFRARGSLHDKSSGHQGCWRSRAIGAPTAIVNAVVNALTPHQTCRHAAYSGCSLAPFRRLVSKKQIHASARLSGCPPHCTIFMHFSNQALVFWSAVRGQIAFSIKRYF